MSVDDRIKYMINQRLESLELKIAELMQKVTDLSSHMEQLEVSRIRAQVPSRTRKMDD